MTKATTVVVPTSTSVQGRAFQIVWATDWFGNE